MWRQQTTTKKIWNIFYNIIDSYMEVLKQKDVYIWGGGVRGILCGMILESRGLRNFKYIDSSPQKQGKKLSNYEIIAYSGECKKNGFIIVSIEYYDEVVTFLHKEGFANGINMCFFELCVEKDYILKLGSVFPAGILIMGSAVLDSIFVREVGDKSLEELLECKNRIPMVKCIGGTCCEMRLFYDVFCLETEANISLRQLILLVSLDTMTSYHHLLPRAQRPDYFAEMAKLADKNASIYREQLQEHCILSNNRMRDYSMEEMYTPDRNDSEKSNLERLKEYANITIMEPFDDRCEESYYLKKLSLFGAEKKIRVDIILEPVNLELCRKVLGKGFDDFYIDKINSMRRFVESSGDGVFFHDFSMLFPQEAFDSITTINSVLCSGFRNIFAKKIQELYINYECKNI